MNITVQRLCGALLAVSLSACASVATTYGPDGQLAYSLNCSGLVRSWGKCLEKAGDLCGTRGYTILEQSGESGFVAGGSGSGAFAGSTHGRTMLVSCKAP